MKIVEGRVRVAASDVANFLACQDLTQLDLRAARRTLRPPHPRDLGFEDLVRRGEEHERAALEGFRLYPFMLERDGPPRLAGVTSQSGLRSKRAASQRLWRNGQACPGHMPS
jgi:hypothetical protein